MYIRTSTVVNSEALCSYV